MKILIKGGWGVLGGASCYTPELHPAPPTWDDLQRVYGRWPQVERAGQATTSVSCVCMRVCTHTSPCPLTWAGGQEATHQQRLLVVGQRLLGQIALPLDLQLQRLGHVWHHPVNGPQHEEHSMLQKWGGWGGGAFRRGHSDTVNSLQRAYYHLKL